MRSNAAFGIGACAARLHVRRAARRDDDPADPRVGGDAAGEGEHPAPARGGAAAALREMRTAIDKFKDAADAGGIAPSEIQAGSENYPPSLETLVEGVTKNNDATGVKLKFLRRIPIDPMTQVDRVGHARLRRQAGLDVVGRRQRLRRLHKVGQARRSMARNTGTGKRMAAIATTRRSAKAASRSSSC